MKNTKLKKKKKQKKKRKNTSLFSFTKFTKVYASEIGTESYYLQGKTKVTKL